MYCLSCAPGGTILLLKSARTPRTPHIGMEEDLSSRMTHPDASSPVVPVESATEPGHDDAPRPACLTVIGCEVATRRHDQMNY